MDRKDHRAGLRQADQALPFRSQITAAGPVDTRVGLAPGLMQAVLDRDADGNLVRKAGIMGIVLSSGAVRPGDSIEVVFPPGARLPLQPV
jgi:hypothetical protein